MIDPELDAMALEVFRDTRRFSAPPRDLFRLWDGVALWVALDEMRTETWPWPPWFSDLLLDPCD